MEKNLREHIKIKTAERKALDPNLSERNELLSQANAFLQQFLEDIPHQKSFSNESADNEKFKISGKSEDISKSFDVIEKDVLNNGIRAASGGHLGYIPGGGLFAAAIGDYIAAVSNAYSGMYYASPGAVEMEQACLNWLKKIFSFPKDSVGNLTSGGSIANLIALTAARDFHQIKNEKIPKAVIYMCEQTHHCVHKAIRIIGLEDAIIRNIPLNEQGKIIPAELKKTIQQDKKSRLKPFIVIASAGTTDVGAVDDLEEIGNICKEEKLWYHIDAAYGGFFVLLESKKHLFQGIEMADSLVIDPHKGMFLPYGIGAVLVKNKQAVFKSHHYTANYMQDAFESDLPVNPADVSPELTKHFRALRMWLPLKMYGVSPFVACLEEKILLTEYFRQEIVKLGFEVGPQPDLSVSYFWYPADNSDEFNRQLLKEMHKDGSVFFSSTVLDGKFVIRVAILSFRTSLETVDKAVRMVGESLTSVQF